MWKDGLLDSASVEGSPNVLFLCGRCILPMKAELLGCWSAAAPGCLCSQGFVVIGAFGQWEPLLTTDQIHLGINGVPWGSHFELVPWSSTLGLRTLPLGQDTAQEKLLEGLRVGMLPWAGPRGWEPSLVRWVTERFGLSLNPREWCFVLHFGLLLNPKDLCFVLCFGLTLNPRKLSCSPLTDIWTCNL